MHLFIDSPQDCMQIPSQAPSGAVMRPIAPASNQSRRSEAVGRKSPPDEGPRHYAQTIKHMKINENNPLPVRKIRSDSTWCALTKSQREKLEAWLCDEGLSYREVQCRAPKELGATLSV